MFNRPVYDVIVVESVKITESKDVIIYNTLYDSVGKLCRLIKDLQIKHIKVYIKSNVKKSKIIHKIIEIGETLSLDSVDIHMYL